MENPELALRLISYTIFIATPVAIAGYIHCRLVMDRVSTARKYAASRGRRTNPFDAYAANVRPHLVRTRVSSLVLMGAALISYQTYCSSYGFFGIHS